MAKRKNPLLRTLIPLAAILIGAGVVAAVAVNSANQTGSSTRGRVENPAPSPDPAEAPDRAEAPAAAPDPTDAAPDSGDARGAAPAEPAAADEPRTTEPPVEPGLDGLRARVFEAPGLPAPIGSLDGVDGHHLEVEFSEYGAGIASVKLGEGFFTEVGSTEHVEIQAEHTVERPGMSSLTAVPFAALAVTVDGHPGSVNLASPGLWRPVEGVPGAFEAIIEDGSGRGVLRLERRFELLPDTFRMVLTRKSENLTAEPLVVRWFETGPIDLPEPQTRYGGDKRRVRFGYLLSEPQQAGSDAVTADHDLRGRIKVLGERTADANGYKRYASEQSVWPTPATQDKGQRLVWAAFSGRYFAVALHPVFDPAIVQPGGGEKLFRQVERIDRLVLNPYAPRPEEAVMVTRITGSPERIAAGGVSEVATGLFAGPLLKSSLTGDALAESLNLGGLIVYNFGGFCGELCTFGWLTHVLFWVLNGAHSVTGDWAAAIIILVLIVRTALHPITRWSQIRLQRFGKQMQEIAPKQQKLREKYKDDQQRLQQEMARLWKEEGINPAGALGCLPMFLQSPVWIALYATLYFAAEMRHEPGFWGVFQAISGGNWKFLADLSSPDAALPLPSFMHFTPPFVGSVYGRIESINLLPILMAVLFWAHQKYLSPPPSASMTPEQEQQQKIMRIMFPIMMPLFMYGAPSGLCVYFITNSALAIIENKHIRSSAEKQGLLDLDKIKAEKLKKREAGKGGFFARLQEVAEQQQQLRAQQQGGSKRVQNTAKPEPKPRNYKKRG